MDLICNNYTYIYIYIYIRDILFIKICPLKLVIRDGNKYDNK